MDAALKKTGLTAVVFGLVCAPVAPVAGALIESAAVRHSASLVTSLGFAVFVYGCIQLARAKGQPWFYGLLGFASVVGLAVLWFVVPDKRNG